MNRNDWEKQVFSSDLNPTARAVALVVGSFGNWNDDRTVWPSVKAIADMAGMHRNTAQKYVDAFIEQGWLRVVKVRPGNVKEYDLCQAVASTWGILSKSERVNNLPQPVATGCYNEEKRLPQPEASVASAPVTNLKEPTNENLLEVTTPAAPVDEIRKDGEDLTTSPNVEREEEVKYPLSGPMKTTLDNLSNTYRATPEQKIEARKIMESRPGKGNAYEEITTALRTAGVEVPEAW